MAKQKHPQWVPEPREPLETIVNFEEGSKLARIYTCNEGWKAALVRLGFEVEDEDSLGGQKFTLPIEYIQIRKPRVYVKPKENARIRQADNLDRALQRGEYAPIVKEPTASRGIRRRSDEQTAEVTYTVPVTTKRATRSNRAVEQEYVEEEDIEIVRRRPPRRS